MKKKLSVLVWMVVLTLLGWGLFTMNGLLPIITGYAAKNLASGVFVANRTQESMEQTDLNFSFIRFTQNKVDYRRKEVVSRFLWSESKAIYIDGFGCVLVRDVDESTIRNRPYVKVPLPDVDPNTVPWPMGDRLVDTVPNGLDSAKLSKAVTRALKDTVGNKNTYAVAVAYKGQLVAEKYRDGFSRRNRFLSWSMAKSFTNALVGLLVHKGVMKVTDHPSIQEWKKDGRSAITLGDLMHMNSGLVWNEDYGARSNVNIMLHDEADMGSYAALQPLGYNPATHWYYSSGSTNIVCREIRTRLRKDSIYYAFPRKELFNPLGMRSVIFEPDASGTFVGSSYLYASMRDYVRFGLLYLQKGVWMGRQILPKGWIDYSTNSARGSSDQYGSFFWLNRNGEFPDLPLDMYMCKGHDGQGIYIIPSLQLVIVRTGFSKKEDFDFSRFLKEIVDSVKGV